MSEMINPDQHRRAFLKNSATAVGAVALGSGAASILSGCGNSVAPQTTAGEQARQQAGLGQLTWDNSLGTTGRRDKAAIRRRY